MIRLVAEIVLCTLGVGFSLSGALGIWRMPDVYSRIHYSGLVATLGLVPAAVGLVVAAGWHSQYADRALLVGLLVLVLNPAAAHALSRAAYKSGIEQARDAVAAERGQRPEVRRTGS